MNILERADQIVNHRSEEKERMYGPFSESMSRAADIYNAIEALDIESFDAGVAEFSKLCGKIAALGMVGVEPAQALAYISECEDRGVTFDNNMRVAKMQTDAQVAVAKCGMTATLS